MLELTEEQLLQLALMDARAYVDGVYDEIVTDDPSLNAPDLRNRLYRAYDYAVGLGLLRQDTLTEFLHYEATAKEFYKRPAIDAWLRKPGATPEQRFADLIAATQSKFPKEEEA